jgi:hypothetical protein
MRNDVNLKEFCEFEVRCEGVRSVLGLGGLEARKVGIGARKGSKINLELNICQVVNNRAFVLSEMRSAYSNAWSKDPQRIAASASRHDVIFPSPPTQGRFFVAGTT